MTTADQDHPMTSQSLEKKQRHEDFVRTFGDMQQNQSQKRMRIDAHDILLASTSDEPMAKSASPLYDQFANKDLPHKLPATPLLKYTPLEQQVVDLKKKHPGVLLAIEVGYKYRFFGDDAKTASKVLHIANFIDRNFYVASVPVHRLTVHIRRLVHAGYKVGVVRQTETAALKASGSNRAGPFERRLQHLYTKGTFVEEMLSEESQDTDHDKGSYVLCIMEQSRGGTGSNELVRTGIVAVQPSSGDIIYDVYDDAYLRNELETRLMHIEPCELLLPARLSKPTEKVITQLTDHLSRVGQDTVRIERMPPADDVCHNYSLALDLVTEFYTQSNQADLLSSILELPELIMQVAEMEQQALAATIRYMREFGLERVFHRTKYFAHFSSRGHMLINGNTAANLEIFRNSTTFSEKGSLLSVLDHTTTRFGRRLFKKWIGQPLVDADRLNERCEAISELGSSQNYKVAVCQELLKSLPDLERGLCRINYGISSPTELIAILDGFLKVTTAFTGIEQEQMKSPYLNRLFEQLPSAHSTVLDMKSMINPHISQEPSTNKVNFFQSDEWWPELANGKVQLANIDNELEEYLQEVRKEVGLDLSFKAVAGIEYLIEVSNKQLNKVPREWIKINNTKSAARFHTPHVINKLKDRERCREQLVLDAEQAYREFLKSISDRYELFRDIIQSLAQLDCLFSLSKVAQRPGYVRPIFSKDTKISVVNGRHPMVEQLLDTYVPNDVSFDGNGVRTLILTGPNMGGKSSYIRQVALLTMMAQIGSFVPADHAEIGIVDAIFTRMGASDNMLTGESTFMVELQETSMIMKQATPRSLVILDELGRGTSTHDGMAIAYAVLHHFITKIGCITMFVTHYPGLGKLADQFPSTTANGHMSFIEDESDDIPKVFFLYKLVPGIAMKSYGLNVAQLAGIPKLVIQQAKIKSEQMEHMQNQKLGLSELLQCIANEDAEGFARLYPALPM
ncbi:hypothetical protein DM01DRAFT_1310070 [Hesseltinella vesiculosa]|uniref:DNA mismatch repair protein MSH3 n=1 Tax=Hesseltinella vesiculosa TaxID=101127 RepID=A0A1X2G9I1_9FUNG|nr:hypothetical protein DM01DRAFT_1310070 [Hesseltinella vesiculosa]